MAGENWLVGWDNRKSHVINPAADAGTGYQFKIRAYYSEDVMPYYGLSDLSVTIVGDPTLRHSFAPAHKTRIVEVNKVER